MKNAIIAVLAFGCIIMTAVNCQSEQQRDYAVAQVNLDAAAGQVMERFYSLAERWGDDMETDTLISNAQWKQIQKHALTPEQAISMAEMVEGTYDAREFASYGDAFDDSEFQEAVRTYRECKEYADAQK